MTYRGIVKGKVIELEEKATLPEGTRVKVVLQEPFTSSIPEHGLTPLRDWLREARLLRVQLPRPGFRTWACSKPRSAAEWRPNGTPRRSVPDYERFIPRCEDRVRLVIRWTSFINFVGSVPADEHSGRSLRGCQTISVNLSFVVSPVERFSLPSLPCRALSP